MNNPRDNHRCSKCILPGNYPDITFDESGTCTYCREYQPQTPAGAGAFAEVLSALPRERTYDCLVPISGGRDSTYVLYQMKKTYGLHVLAYNYDNGFVSPVARENVERIARALDVEVVRARAKNGTHGTYLRHVVKHNLNKSPAHVMVNLCAGCKNGIWGGAQKVAKQKNIPLIVFGESGMESSVAKDKIGDKLRPSLAERISSVLRMPMNFLARQYYFRLFERDFPLEELASPRTINYFDYFYWDEAQMLELLDREMKWSTESDMSSWRFDCQLHAVLNYLQRKLYGFTEHEELYSKMIREGALDQEEALARIRTGNGRRKKELEVIDEVFSKLQLSEQERLTLLNMTRTDGGQAARSPEERA